MNPEVKALWDDCEARRHALIAKVEALSPESRSRHGKGSSFTPNQVLMHCAQIDEFYASSLSASKYAGQKSRPRFSYKLAVYFMKRGKTLPAPSFGKVRSEPTFEAARDAWDKARVAVGAVFEEVKGPDDVVVSTFEMGRLSVRDYCELQNAHMHYHTVLFPDVKA